MKFESGHVYHVFNQGNNKQNIFLSDNEYQTFLNYTVKSVLPYSDMLAYSLMPNHFHFELCANRSCETLIKQGGLSIDPLTNGIRKLLSGYARIFNNQYQKSGSLFRQKTKAKCLTDSNTSLTSYSGFDYCSTCFYYVHMNAVKAGFVIQPEDWKWSSYAFYAGMVKESICNKDLAYRFCGYSDQDFKLIKPSEDTLKRFLG